MTTEEQEHIQFIRNHVPEPTHVEAPVLKFKWPDKTDWSLAFADPDGMDWSKLQVSTGELRRVLFCERKMKFWAWTYDGKTPLFPGI